MSDQDWAGVVLGLALFLLLIGAWRRENWS